MLFYVVAIVLGPRSCRTSVVPPISAKPQPQSTTHQSSHKAFVHLVVFVASGFGGKYLESTYSVRTLATSSSRHLPRGTSRRLLSASATPPRHHLVAHHNVEGLLTLPRHLEGMIYLILLKKEKRLKTSCERCGVVSCRVDF